MAPNQRPLKIALTDFARQGFEVVLMVIAVGTGAGGLWNPSGITSRVDPLLPTWGRLIWYGGLLVGGMITIIGIAMARPFGPLVERAGLVILTGSCVSYLALSLPHGWAGLQQALLILLFTLVVLARIWLISREPYEIASAIKLIRSTMDGPR